MLMIIQYQRKSTNLIAIKLSITTSVALHPTKSILATGSDDHTWRIWAIPSGEHIMTGEGHGDWISSVQFHPK